MFTASIMVFTFLCFAFAEPAQAYLDPGTGSAILQGILAALAAVAVVGRLYWNRLAKFLGLRKDTETDRNQDKADD